MPDEKAQARFRSSSRRNSFSWFSDRMKKFH
jgi:hypothetical protein